MRILWLTPTGERSAIGRASVLVIDELVKQGHDVVVVSSQTEPPHKAHEFLARTFPSVPQFVEQESVRDFDAIVAHFGDHFPNHAGCLHFLNHPRLIGVFHDADMSNFGNGFFAFGSDLLPTVPQSALTRGAITGSIAAQCTGAVAHSPFYAPLLDPCDGPLAIIPLAWGIKDQPARPAKSDERRIGIVTIGHINRNKCADRVIRAIGGSSTLKNLCDYRLVGAIEDRERDDLTALALEEGVSLTILGSVDDATLDAEIARADIVSCLREPVLEGASASAIEAMMHGKAVMVSHAGFYLELPSDCVVRIPAETRPEDIRAGLEAIATDKSRREELARRAKAFADEVFSPKAYGRDLLGLIDEVRAVSACRPLQDKIAHALIGWGLHAQSGSSLFLADAIEEMAAMNRRSSVSLPQGTGAP